MGFNPRLAPYSIITEIFDVDPAADKIYSVFRFPTQGKFLNAFIASDVAVATVTFAGAWLPAPRHGTRAA